MAIIPTWPSLVRSLTLWLCRILTVAASVLVALLAYDTLLTILDEVKLIWRHRFSIVSAIFIINRIAALLYILDVMLGDVNNVRHLGHMANCHLTILLDVSLL